VAAKNDVFSARAKEGIDRAKRSVLHDQSAAAVSSAAVFGGLFWDSDGCFQALAIY
jgi:hypothetical protein